MDIISIGLVVLLGIGVLLLFVVFLKAPKVSPKKGGSSYVFSPQKWQEVQAMLATGGPANFRQAIMEGDKLVDAVLRSKVKGETMGELLKNSRHLFSHETYNSLWTAHKIRNKVAHEADFEGLSSDARLAINGFEKALKELKVL